MMFGHFSIVRLLDAWVKCRLTSMPNHSLHPALRLKCSVATSKDVVSFFPRVCFNHYLSSYSRYHFSIIFYFVIFFNVVSNIELHQQFPGSDWMTFEKIRLFSLRMAFLCIESLLDDGHPCTDASSDGHSNESFDVCPTWVECLEIEKKSFNLNATERSDRINFAFSPIDAFKRTFSKPATVIAA